MMREVLVLALLAVSILSGGLMFLEGSQETYDSVVVFRNDDVGGMDESFQEVNQVFIENEVPVTHGLIPEKVESGNDNLCQDFRDLKASNPETVNYAAHGYNHDGHEFVGLNRNRGEEKLDNVSDFFNTCLEREPDVFIPPHNDLSSFSRVLLAEYNYTVVSGHEQMNWQRHNSRITANKSEMIDERPLYIGQSRKFVSAWHTSPVEFNNVSSLKSGFDESVEGNRIHVQTLHHGPMTGNNRTEDLEELINYMQGEDVIFLSLQELGELFRHDRINSVENGWQIEN